MVRPNPMMENSNNKSNINNNLLIDQIVDTVYQALLMVCGGNDDFTGGEKQEQLLTIIKRTVFIYEPTSTAAQTKSYDIEIRTANALFQRYKIKGSTSNNNDPNNMHKMLLITKSDMGVVRTFESNYEFVTFILPHIEHSLRELQISWHVRVTKQGFIAAVSKDFIIMQKQQQDLLPCPYCPMFCNNDKGLWWHLQIVHNVGHNEAMEFTTANNNTTHAVVLYKGDEDWITKALNTKALPSSLEVIERKHETNDNNPWSFVKAGDLNRLKKFIKEQSNQKSICNCKDHHGATLLHWAAGGGFIDIVQFLVDECGFDIDQKQTGKCAFSGRTALHWACRNGHLSVVQYLIEHSSSNKQLKFKRLEAATADGTTAFCWAAWQGHRHVLEYLYNIGCCVESVNSYGCNAVLWCAQGNGNPELIAWLESIGCPANVRNHSGHGVLHKAAQRGQRDLCEWFVTNRLIVWNNIDLVGPDNDNCCPSDLAGMEGHVDLAMYLSKKEQELVMAIKNCNSDKLHLPGWLTPIPGSFEYKRNDWEPAAGVFRMRSVLTHSQEKATRIT